MKRSNSNPKNNEIYVLESLDESEQQRMTTNNYSIKQIKKVQTLFFEENQQKYKEDVTKFDKKMDKIENNIKIEIYNQTKNFEEIKRKKLDRIQTKKSKKSFEFE